MQQNLRTSHRKTERFYEFRTPPWVCRLHDRTTVEGRGHHLEEIGATEGAFYRDPHNMEIVKEKIGRYKAMKFLSVD